MLRVRPIHFTSRLDAWERLLTGLGMVKTVDEPTWREFDAGSGRLALHFVEQGSAEDGTTSLGVEVGDLQEFARRTKEAGTAAGTTAAGTNAELIDADHGPSCRITAADGFSFLADPATRATDGSWGGSAEADPGVAVVGVWFSEDAVAATRTLRDIGARPRPLPGTGASTGDADTDTVESEAFTAKNGGILMVGAGTGSGSAGLGFEYAGDLTALRERLNEAGNEAAVIEEAAVPTLHVANPDANGIAAHPPLWISAAPSAG
ncbi:MAG TPA: VOC family protein [Arthrobacter sp.]|nr:VOC family protein [Arthrobacter sp.]